MVVTASKLRENIYKILDEIVETGVPVEVTRKGVKLRIQLEIPRRSKLANLKKRKDWIPGKIDPASLGTWRDEDGKREWLEEWNNFK